MFKINEGPLDRLLRLTFGVILILLGMFWLAAVLKWIALIVGIILIITGATGFCGAYPMVLKIDTLKYGKNWSKWVILFWLFDLLILLIAGTYGSIFFTKKAFLNDYNLMNNPYKQVLYQTGQGNLEQAQREMSNWEYAWSGFRDKYAAYRPWSIMFDKQFSDDLKATDAIREQVTALVYEENLPQAHLALEKVRPIYNEMLKRNGFSLFAVALVDFHDAMEVVLDAADDKNTAEVLSAYEMADAKLKDIESLENDQEIQDIRANLEKVKFAAENNPDELPDLAAKLKSSFVKVYLKRG